MAFPIHELNHVAIHVADLERSMRFYEQVMELPKLQRPAFPFPGAWYALGSQELHLIADDSLTPDSRRHHHFALLVDDIDAAKADLESKGVTVFDGPMQRPDGPMQLFFHDPDGYRIEVYHTPEGFHPACALD
jgi:lactoylglutathione lyase